MRERQDRLSLWLKVNQWPCDGPCLISWALALAFLWFSASQVVSAWLGITPDAPLVGTISYVEATFAVIAWIAGITVLLSSLDARRDRRALLRLKINGQLRERAEAAVRNESQRAWTVACYLALIGGAMLAPSPQVSGVRLLSVVTANLFISSALVKAYCSVMDRADRRRDHGEDH